LTAGWLLNIKIKIMKGGDEAQFYKGSLFKVAEPVNERSEVYGLMTERCDVILETFRKEEKQ
jgi:hypothetical protein